MSLAYMAQREVRSSVAAAAIRNVLEGWVQAEGLSLHTGTSADARVDWNETHMADGSWSAILVVERERRRDSVLVVASTARAAFRVEVEDTGAHAGEVVPVHEPPGLAAALVKLFSEDAETSGPWTGPSVLVGCAVDEAPPRIVAELDRRVVGMAQVVRMDPTSLRVHMEEHGVRGTARRGTVLLDLGGGHRRRTVLYPSSVASRDPAGVARRVQRDLIAAAALEPMPAHLERAMESLRSSRGDEAALDDLVRDEERLMRQITELRSEVERLEFERDAAIEALVEVEDEQNGLQTRVRRLERIVYQARLFDFSEPEPDEEDLDLETCSDLLAVLPDVLLSLRLTAALSHAAELDAHPQREFWARKAWRLLRGVNDYAGLKGTGDFAGNLWTYCSNPPSHAIGLPMKRVALHESESTQANPDLMELRKFRVPQALHPTGRILMPAHLKVDNQSSAPRIHFYDDTGGATGQFYIGYFGPHLPI